MSGGRVPICDFCSGVPVAWAYPTDDFTLDSPKGGEWGSHGSWACCDPCARLIERDDYEALLKRMVKRVQRANPAAAQAPRKELVAHTRKLLDGFVGSRTDAPRVAADPVDPAREDEWGRMMRMDGRECEFVVERPEDGDPLVTFSKDALENVIDSAGKWIGSRVLRSFERGVAPQRMRISVTVDLDSAQQWSTGAVGPPGNTITLVDGQTRKDAAS